MNFYEMISNQSKEYKYQLLDRMKSDCDYYLGAGNRQPQWLWGKNEVDHIDYMKTLWNSFGESEKPEWLSYDQILDYEEKIGIKAILVEMDYKGYYERFALTPEEFEKEFPETYEHFGPIEEENSDTVKSLVHIWFEPCVVGDGAWERHFTDMANGLPESDIESGNLAYIDYNQMQSLSMYLKDTAVFHCRAVYQHDNYPFAAREIKSQILSTNTTFDYRLCALKCVEENKAEVSEDFPNDRIFTFEFDIKTPRDSAANIKSILDMVDGGELIDAYYERSSDKPSLEAQMNGAEEKREAPASFKVHDAPER